MTAVRKVSLSVRGVCTQADGSTIRSSHSSEVSAAGVTRIEGWQVGWALLTCRDLPATGQAV